MTYRFIRTCISSAISARADEVLKLLTSHSIPSIVLDGKDCTSITKSIEWCDVFIALCDFGISNDTYINVGTALEKGKHVIWVKSRENISTWDAHPKVHLVSSNPYNIAEVIYNELANLASSTLRR